MTAAALLLTAAILLVGLLRAEKRGGAVRILPVKTPLSLLFVVAWFLQPADHPTFAGLVLAALVCCLAGDILLAFEAPRAFLAGLVSFLLGHAIYAAAFFMTASIGGWTAMATVGLILAGSIIWRWLSPHLNGMAVPVLAYIVVISVMVVGALGITGNSNLPPAVRLGIPCGAALFYLSDLFVARQRFVGNSPVNRWVGLPLYYAAQFLLAFCAAWVPGT